MRTNADQALQWAREGCPDPDADGEDELFSDAVPKAVVDATWEMARELLIADRTAAPPGAGLKYANVGTTQTGYDKTDRRPVISHVALETAVEKCGGGHDKRKTPGESENVKPDFNASGLSKLRSRDGRYLRNRIRTDSI